MIDEILDNLKIEITPEYNEVIFFNSDFDFIYDSILQGLNKDDFYYCIVVTCELLLNDIKPMEIEDYLCGVFKHKLNEIRKKVVSVVGDWQGTLQHKIKFVSEAVRLRNNTMENAA